MAASMLDTHSANSLGYATVGANTPRHPTAPGTKCEAPRGWVRVYCSFGGDYWVPVRCRMCDGCRAWRRRRVVRRILGGLDGHKWVVFVTLTTRPGTGWGFIMRRWTSLMWALRRQYGGLDYAVVKETGSKSGMRHLHAILAGPGARWIPHQALRRAWEARTGAKMVNIKRVSMVAQGARRGVARYVAKYVAKSLGDGEVAKQVTFSRYFGGRKAVVGHKRVGHKRVVEFDYVGPRPGAGLVLPSGVVVRAWCEACLGPPPPLEGMGVCVAGNITGVISPC